MFTQVRGWTPPAGWMVRGAKMTVCSVGNLVCLVDTKAASINEVMRELQDASHW
jgi:roadblock/LC7 domain-containing protein